MLANAGAHTKQSIWPNLQLIDEPHFLKLTQMNPTKLMAIVLIVAGSLGLAYGGFSYTKETTGMTLGPIERKVQEQQNVDVPLIVSAGAIAIGVFLLVAVGRK
jgi:uncharacterized membrane protein YidH (DUF202 family)